ncbi:CpaE family protein [Oerskovia sp. NPDC060338]|uniref:AAA family ATPase n=1 Tax=Oerskovia sp. NPDC060338 TaxID=3347100 RepID=UPI003655C5A1
MTLEPTTPPASVLCAVRGDGETVVVTALTRPGSGVAVARRCADLTELLAAAGAGAGTAAVISADLPGLDREAVAHLHEHGVRVVALADGPGWLADRLRAIGIDVVLDEGTPTSVLVETVRDEARGRGSGTGPADAPGAPPAGRGSGRPGGAPPVPAPVETRRGRVLAVWGPTGAPGRTTVAVHLAAELAGLGPERGIGRRRRGRRRNGPSSGTEGSRPQDVLLVDADTYAGSVAQHLGLLDESSGIAAAARSASHGTLDLAGLARLAPEVAPRLRVLTGIARAARWPELPGSSLDVVWEHGRALADWTVIDCGFGIEQDELLTYDTRAPQRNGATLSALAAADAVLVVGGADAIGIQRLVRGLAELADSGAGAGAHRIVVANRVRASAAGPRPEVAVRDALGRYGGVVDLHVLPDDRASLDATLLAGRTLAELAPEAAVRHAVAALAQRVRTELGTVPVAPAAGGSRERVPEPAH